MHKIVPMGELVTHSHVNHRFSWKYPPGHREFIVFNQHPKLEACSISAPQRIRGVIVASFTSRPIESPFLVVASKTAAIVMKQ